MSFLPRNYLKPLFLPQRLEPTPEPLYNVCPSATSRLRSAGFADWMSNKKSSVPRTFQYISVHEKN